MRDAPHVDVTHDLNEYPYPFADSEFDRIEMSHIIEHIDRPLKCLNEIHRIARDGATIRVFTPHYSSQLSYGDFEHYHHFGYITFLGLERTGFFKIAKHKIWFTDFYKVFGISVFANLFPRRWEKYMAFIWPALFVEVFLTVVKDPGGAQVIDKYTY